MRLVLEGAGDYYITGGKATPPWSGLEIKTAEVKVKEITSTRNLFFKQEYLESVNLSGLDTGNLTDMAGMFAVGGNDQGTEEGNLLVGGRLVSLDLTGLNVSGVTDMSRLFSHCGGLRNVKIDGWKTGNVRNMERMFESCVELELTADTLKNLDTSNVTNMSRMFAQCTNLRALKGVDGFDTGNVTNMSYMFAGCGGLQSLDLSSFDMGNVTAAAGMLDGCTGLKWIGAPVNCKVDVTLPDGPWYRADGTAYAGTTLPKNLSASITLYKEKPAEGAIKRASVSGITISSKEYDGTSCAYAGTPVLTDETGNSITGVTITPSYSGTLVDETPYSETEAAPTLAGSYTLSFWVSDLDTSKYRLGKTTYRFSIRRRNVTITAPDARIEKGEDLPAVEKLTCTVEGLLPGVTLSKEPKVRYKGNIDTQKAGIYEIIPYGAELASADAPNYQFRYQNGKLQVGDPSELPLAEGKIEKINWEIDSAGRLTLWGKGDYGQIDYYGNRKELPWTNEKNRKLIKSAQVKVSGMTATQDLFNGCENLESVDLSGFDAGSVTNATGMFAGCSGLEELDVSGWDTGKVTAMYGMFSGCSALVELDLSSFNMGGMENSMMMGSNADGMFAGCSALSCLLTPKNYKCEESVMLPKQNDTDTWKDKDGNLYTELPKNRKDSVLLYRNNYLEDENGNIKQIVTVSGIGIESKTYDGQPCAYAGTAVLTDLDGKKLDVTPSYVYQGTLADGSAYAETGQAPAQSGSYTLTIRMPDAEKYILRKNSYSFVIEQKELIIRVPSVMIEIGGQVPALKWSAEGLLAGEKFLTEPVLRFDPNPVLTDRAGSYRIIPYGADAGNNYRIIYQNGALVVGKEGDVLPEDIPADGVIPEGLWIAGISAGGYDYTGKAQKPEVRVYDHKTLLKEKTDYSISYKNNTKAYPYNELDKAFDSKKAPTITVTGRGNYTGRDTQTFRIMPLDIGSKESDGNISFAADDMAVAYNKKAQKPTPVLMWKDKKLKNRTDYTFIYYGGSGGQLDAVKEAGEYTIVLSGQGNFTGTRRIRLLVTADLKLAGRLSVASPKAQPYTGSAITPQLTVKDGRTVLTENTHYTVTYSRNTAVGTAYAVVKGIEAAGYSGTKRVSFKITGIPVNKAAVIGLPARGSEFVYGGLAFTPQLSLSRKERKNGVDTEIPLTEGTDYTVVWQKNREAGTASVIFTGKGAYTGTMKKTFKIKPFDMAANENNRVTAKLALSIVPYAKGGAKPKPEVVFLKDDKTKQILEEGKDYTLSYKNQSALYDGSNPQKKPPTVTIRGKGCFKGTYAVPLTYQITQQDLDNGLTLTAADKTYQNKKNSYATRVTVIDLDGKALRAGTDYDKKVTYTYQNETTVQTAPVKNVSPGGPVVRAAGAVVEANDIIPAGTVVCVTVKAKDGGNYTGTLKGEYRISKSSISSAAVSIPKQTYTGQPITLKKEDIVVKVKGKPVDENQEQSQWEIIPGSYKNNTKKGTASVTIRGVDNYGGEKTVKFTIKAKGFLWWWR